MIVNVLLSGIATGVPYFLAAAGLALLFGVMGILNFSHGAAIMVAAYLMTTFLGGTQPSVAKFALAILLSCLVTTALGVLTERLAFRRTYRAGRNAIASLLVSFGLLLLISGAAPAIWGISSRVQPAPRVLSGHTKILGSVVSAYDAFLVVLGIVVSGALYILLKRSRWGKVIEATAHDRLMANALGISATTVSVAMFALAGALAGLAGAVITPAVSVDTGLASNYQMFAFVAIVIGGLGSMPGALIGSLILGITESVLVTYADGLAPFSLYIAAATVLLVRRHGLFPTVEVERAA